MYDAESPFLELTDEQWDRTLGINLGGSFVLGQAAALTMVRDGVAGRIVFVSSINGLSSEPELRGLQREQVRVFTVWRDRWHTTSLRTG